MNTTEFGPKTKASRDSAMRSTLEAHAAGHRVWIRYSGPHGIYLRGPKTGEPYTFNAGDSTLVDAADALALLESGLFSRD